MSTFAYVAFDKAGQKTTGTIPADSRAAAMDAITGRGLTPTELTEQAGAGAIATDSEKPTRVPTRTVEAFTRELANLLNGGLSLSRSLSLLKREARHPAAKHVWTEIHDDVVGGTSLADALSKWPQSFSSIYVAMVRAGETGGFLPVVLQQISDFREHEQELMGKFKAALVYPVLLVVFATGVLIFLLLWFIPKFIEIFESFGKELPLVTRFVIGITEFLMSYGLFVALALVIGTFVFNSWIKTPAGRLAKDRFILRIPLLGTTLARFALVRFARMLGTLIEAGVPLVASLKVSREALGNESLQETITVGIDEVQRGTPLSRALATNSLLFPPSVTEMMAVSEETGRTGQELLRLSSSYEKDLDRNLRTLVSAFTPAVLLVMAAVIGTIVVSMLLPLFTLQDMVN